MELIESLEKLHENLPGVTHFHKPLCLQSWNNEDVDSAFLNHFCYVSKTLGSI